MRLAQIEPLTPEKADRWEMEAFRLVIDRDAGSHPWAERCLEALEALKEERSAREEAQTQLGAQAESYRFDGDLLTEKENAEAERDELQATLNDVRALIRGAHKWPLSRSALVEQLREAAGMAAKKESS